MRYVKRFAFWPLLAYVCMVVTSVSADPVHGTKLASWAGLALSVPLAWLIDRRRQRNIVREDYRARHGR